MSLRAFLFACALLPSISLASSPGQIRFTHESDKGQYISITVSVDEGERRFAFAHCVTDPVEKCHQIGNYEHYLEGDLNSLLQSYSTTAKSVFWTEVALVCSAAMFVALSVYRNPSLVKDFESGRSMAPLEALSAPRSLRPAPEPQKSTDSALAPVAKYVGGLFERHGKGLLVGLAFNIRNELLSFVTDMSSLLAIALSPAEHYRSAHLMQEIIRATSNVDFKKREYASVKEYFSHFQFANIAQLKTKIEDLLATGL